MIRNLMFSSNILRNTSQQLRRYASNQPTYEKSVVNVTLLGRAGKDPEQREKGDRSIVTFSVATSHSYKDENGEMARCSAWHQIVVFNESLGRLVFNNLKKGQRTMVTGKMAYREVVDEDGNPKQLINVVADDVIVMKN
ncbi:single-stranded DNA-binding protein, mitochondrial-like isoform X2 [Bradysia coprophila]|uniref:single-stranded DNA-binding protein, mitochondrial-like isoform X2 n=1 Tax=Bradysia coprophila TaxID=38358 RepID=UPI00187D9338|nr:single-stranded DNA-binding protein, mitochondrial-like isoform X2 [Bradysia coprophila]